MEADLREAKELLQKPQPKPVPEESKTKEVAKVPIPQPVMPGQTINDDS